MQAEIALAMTRTVSVPFSPAKKLALSVWADDGGAMLSGSGSEVVFYAAQSPEWVDQVRSGRRKGSAVGRGTR